MKILLISDLPPCSDYSGPLLTSELCTYLCDHELLAFVAKNISLAKLTIDPALTFVDKIETFKPNENTFNKKLGRYSLVNFIYEFYREFYHVKNLYRRVAKFILQHKVDKVWIILQGQTMINLAKLIIDSHMVPVYVQVWDEPKWWLIANKVNSFSAGRILKHFDYVIRNCNACGVASSNMSTYYNAKYGTDCQILIPTLKNLVVFNKFKSIEESQSITIGMCGQLYAIDEWNSFIGALESVNWQICGKTIYVAYVGYSLAITSSSHILNYGYKTQEETLQILCNCDIQYCPYIINPEYEEISRYSFPSKVVTYLATCKPIYYHGPLYASPAKLIMSNNIGVVCDSLNINVIISRLEELVGGYSEQININVENIYQKYFTSEQLRHKFFALLSILE